MEHRNRRAQYSSTICVALASLCLGATSTWPSPVLPKFTSNETDVKITDHEIAWLIAINSPGYMFGSLISGYTVDRFGRKSTILASVLPLILGTIIAILAVQPLFLYLTRFLWGFGTGMVGMTVTMYIGEIADKEIRGTLMLITKVLYNFGGLIMMSIGPFVKYTFINGFLLVLPGFYLFACLFIPESPYYYIKEEEFLRARKVLEKLRGFKDQSTLEEEFIVLQNQVQNDMKRSTSRRELFTGVAYRKAIVIATVLKTVQIMMGSGTITQYLGLIMQESGANMSTKTVLIIFGIIRFIVVLISTVLVDRVGRRTLLFYGCLVYSVSLTIVATYFFLKDIVQIDISTLSTFGFIPFSCIILSNVISTLAIDCVIFIIPGEIFPMNIKAVALSTLSVYGGVLGFAVAHTYQIIKDLSGLTGVFLVFATVTYYGCVFVKYYMPETKGKSLHQILKDLQGIYYVDCNSTRNTDMSQNERNESEMKLVKKEITSF